MADLPSTTIYRLRTSSAYRGTFRFFSRTVWPNVFGFAMVLLLAIVLPVRLGFEAASRASWLPSSNCAPPVVDAFDVDQIRDADARGDEQASAGLRQRLRQRARQALHRDGAEVKPYTASTDPAGTFALWPHMTCNATGAYAQEGQSYRVEIALPDASCETDETARDPQERRTGRWTDRETPIDPAAPGFSTLDRVKAGWSGLVFAAAQPLRRVLSADWFSPIAVIGTSLPERHVLISRARDDADSSSSANAAEEKTIVYDFTAGRSGPITLYVNDAILPCWRWDCLYANNAGGPARVRITRLDDEGRPAAGEPLATTAVGVQATATGGWPGGGAGPVGARNQVGEASPRGSIAQTTSGGQLGQIGQVGQTRQTGETAQVARPS